MTSRAAMEAALALLFGGVAAGATERFPDPLVAGVGLAGVGVTGVGVAGVGVVGVGVGVDGVGVADWAESTKSTMGKHQILYIIHTYVGTYIHGNKNDKN